MRSIQVKVHPGSSKREVVEKEEILHCYLHAKPQKGEANKEAIKLVAEYLGLPKSQVSLQKGQKSRYKTFEIDEG